MSLTVLCRYLQANSFPVISPLNETFPKDFNTIRTELHNVQLSTNNKTVEFFIDVPSPGGWYMKVYLGDYVDESIKQKVNRSIFVNILYPSLYYLFLSIILLHTGNNIIKYYINLIIMFNLYFFFVLP